MRAIRFRGKRIDGKGWTFGLLVAHTRSYARIKTGLDAENHEVHPETVGQFTGMQDKTGTDIYEGDWCRAERRGNEGIQVIQGEIIMDEFMWCIKCPEDCGNDIFCINWAHNWEAIGKIHDNDGIRSE